MSGADSSHRPDRKNQLTAIAARLFCARGYNGVGINDIAAAAGITGPALYRHFADPRVTTARQLLAVRPPATRATPGAVTPDTPRPVPPGGATGTLPRREQLLTAAAGLFHRDGFHAVTMEAIGTAAGIAGPSI